MIIGRYNSFAVTPAGNTGYRRNPDGTWRYIGLQGAGGSSTGTGYGKTQAEARADFCKKYGVNGKCYGDAGGPPHDKVPAAITVRERTSTGSRERVVPNPASPKYDEMMRGARGSGMGCGKICASPPNTPMGYYHWLACEFESKTCLPTWGFPVALGIGGLLLLALIAKRR